MNIRFDPESRCSVDDATGEYLELHFHHYQDPLRHYTLHTEHGEMLLSAAVAERRTDTRGDGTVGLIEADVFRVSIPNDDGALNDLLDDQHPAVRRFIEFLEVRLSDRRGVPQRVVIGTKLGGAPPLSNI
jgi:hypothetical protein